MGKIIVDTKMIGMSFMEVIFREADNLAKEKGLDPKEVAKSLAEAQTQEDFIKSIKSFFGDELIILF